MAPYLRLTSSKGLFCLATYILSLASLSAASSCVAFDADFNLYAFGLSGADYNLGAQSTWTSGTAQKLTSTGRPPFDGSNTQCFLSQFQNVIYVLGASSSNPGNVYIFNADSSSWSTQKTTLSGFDPSTAVSILDHDTNVFFGLSGDTLYQADFGQLKTASGSAIEWETVENPSFKTSGYKPVMALAQNHIYFLDVPGAAAGNAYIFVIHYAYFQPTAQSYPASSGNTFPAAHGSTASIFQAESVAQQFAFVPDDGSATYIVDVEKNSTVSMAGPSITSSGSVYTASTSALVQLTSTGALYFLPVGQSSSSKKKGTRAAGAWSAITVSGLPATGSGSSSASQSSTATKSASKSSSLTSSVRSTQGTATSSGTASASTPTSSGNAGEMTREMNAGALAFAAIAAATLLSWI